jgi:4-carboxymuconolactone decarboxylase
MAEHDAHEQLPATFRTFVEKYPAFAEAHDANAKAEYAVGPLDEKMCELIKIGICVGAELESALRSHVRKAMQRGATKEEIEQAILLAMNTCGWPRAVAAWRWAEIQFERGA